MKDRRETGHLDSWRVVVADDDADTRLLMASALRRAGLTVAEAENGRDLVEQVQNLSPCRTLVVTDIDMPVLDGIAAARSVLDRDPSTPILVVTALADDGTLGASAGARRVLSKPLAPAVLVRAALELIASEG